MDTFFSDNDIGTFAKVLVDDVSYGSRDSSLEKFNKLGKGSPDFNGSSSTYLGSNLWENTIPFDPGFKDSLDYLELENFLDDNREFVDISHLVESIEDRNDNSPSTSHASTVLPCDNFLNPDLSLPSFNIQGTYFSNSPKGNDTATPQSSTLSTPTHAPIDPFPALNESSRDSSSFSGFAEDSQRKRDDSLDSSFDLSDAHEDKPQIKSRGKNLKTVKEYITSSNKKRSAKSLREHLTTPSTIVKKKKKSNKSKICDDALEDKRPPEMIKVSIAQAATNSDKPKKSSRRKNKSLKEDISTKSEKRNSHKQKRSKKKPSKFAVYDSDDENCFDGELSPLQREESNTPIPECSYNDEIMVENEALASLPGEDFNPSERIFTEEELKPQPIIKKGKKKYVPSDAKDDKYWARRQKNNTAAKRSRDARRTKENQIILRANFLEDRHTQMEKELQEAKEYIQKLESKLSKYEKF